jgi:hypothetical protein
VGQLGGVDSLLLDMLADSAQDRWGDSIQDFPGVFPAHSGRVAHPLSDRRVLVAEYLSRVPGWGVVRRLFGRLLMDRVGAAGTSMCRKRGGDCRDRNVDGLLRYRGVDAEALGHLLRRAGRDVLLDRIEYR